LIACIIEYTCSSFNTEEKWHLGDVANSTHSVTKFDQ
jgi:hypothetical protein